MTVSAENMLMPLSVFIEGHLFVSFLEQELESGMDFECFIECPPEGKEYIQISFAN